MDQHNSGVDVDDKTSLRSRQNLRYLYLTKELQIWTIIIKIHNQGSMDGVLIDQVHSAFSTLVRSWDRIKELKKEIQEEQHKTFV